MCFDDYGCILCGVSCNLYKKCSSFMSKMGKNLARPLGKEACAGYSNGGGRDWMVRHGGGGGT